MKEWEKIDKMVRKHDEKQLKAAKKAQDREVEEKSRAAVVTVVKEGKTKRALKRMTMFRSVSVPLAESAPVKDGTRLHSSTLDGKTRKAMSTSPEVMSRAAKESDESSRGSQTMWSPHDWTDVPLPAEQPLASLTGDSPAKIKTTQSKKAEQMSRGGSAVVHRSAGTSTPVAATTAAGPNRKRNSKRISGEILNHADPAAAAATASNKRLSFLGHSYMIGRDFIEGADLGWEDATGSTASNTDGQTTPTLRSTSNKRSTLLDSLYKDIDEMESAFVREHTPRTKTSSRVPHADSKQSSKQAASYAEGRVEEKSTPRIRDDLSRFSNDNGVSAVVSTASPKHGSRNMASPPSSDRRLPETYQQSSRRTLNRAGTLPEAMERGHGSPSMSTSSSSPQML